MTSAPLLDFLQKELAISPRSLAIAERSAQDQPSMVPIILWQYGLITLAELDRIYDWLEQV
ncbi:MAG: DUF2949 domain-containing protein [Microcystaceae cyanobacterium]|nr:DUF2949 domain-containing protein [Merismopediaceae bacterium]